MGMERGQFDWECPSCQESNFAKRRACFRCRKPKPDSIPDAPAYRPSTAAGDGAQSTEFKSGDWACESCSAHNYARRTACFRCQAARTDAEADNFKGFKHKKGDWVCRECKMDNFAKRMTCKRCEVARPPSRFYWLCPSEQCGFTNLGVRPTCMRCDTANPADPMEYARPGDWKCTCGHLNFASRSQCQRCEGTLNQDCQVKEGVEQLELEGDGAKTLLECEE